VSVSNQAISVRTTFPRAADAYLWGVAGVALLLVGGALANHSLDVGLSPSDLAPALTLMILAIAAQHFPVPITPRHKVDASMAAYFACLLRFGSPAALALVAISQLVGQSTLALRRGSVSGRRLRSRRSVIFNTGQVTCAIAFGAFVSPVRLQLASTLSLDTLIRVIGAAIVVYSTNTFAVSVMIGLQRHENPFAGWLTSTRVDLLEFVGLFLVGCATAVLTLELPWAPTVMAIPAVAVCVSLKRSADSVDRAQEARQVAETATVRARELQHEIERDWAPLAAVLDGLTEGVIVFTTTLRATYVNPRAAQVFRLNRSTAIGRHAVEIFDAIAPDLSDASTARDVWQSLLDQSVTTLHGEIELSGSPPRSLQLAVFPVVGTRGPEIGLVIRDVTDARVRAVLEERARIAMDLHDGAIQSLYGVALSLKARERSQGASPDASRNSSVSFESEISTLNRVMGELRDYVFDLRQSEVLYRSLSGSLAELLRNVETRADIRVTLDLDPRLDEKVDREAAWNVYQIVREATANVLRHASARNVGVDLTLSGELAILRISDDGHGFELTELGRSEGCGLHNIAERARGLGGECGVDSQPGRGTVIQVSFPVREMKDEER